MDVGWVLAAFTAAIASLSTAVLYLFRHERLCLGNLATADSALATLRAAIGVLARYEQRSDVRIALLAALAGAAEDSHADLIEEAMTTGRRGKA